MVRTRKTESITEQIALAEAKFRKLKDRCDAMALELEALYAAKKALEDKAMLDAIAKSKRTPAEIMAFLESKN